MRKAEFFIGLIIAVCMVVSLMAQYLIAPEPAATPQVVVNVNVPPPVVIRETRTEVREVEVPASGPTTLQWDLEGELNKVEREVRSIEEDVDRALGGGPFDQE